MLIETGRVVAIEADAVWVETIRASTCGRCAARSGCGRGVLARATGARGLIRVRATESLRASDCQIHDQVTIELPESAILQGSALMYLLPLILGIIFSMIGDRWNELAAVLGFGAGLLMGFTGIRWLPVLLGAEDKFEPQLAEHVVNKSLITTSTT